MNMKVTIYAEKRYMFKIKNNVIKAMIALARNHYDANCQAAAERGGFIYGWFNQAIWSETENYSETDIAEITYRQIDCCLKILEQLQYAGNFQLKEAQDNWEDLRSFQDALREILRASNQVGPWSKEIDV